MPRQLRIEYEGAIYHVMNRGDRREPIFGDDEDRERFLATLADTCAKTGWQVHAYCLMPNHFHMVVETPQANLVAGMKWCLGTYSSRFNRRHKLSGHVFGGRYKSLIVDHHHDGYLRTVCEYVHLNPVRAKLVDPKQSLREFRWSSYKDYLGLPNRRPRWLRVDRLFGEMRISQDSTAGRREFERQLETRRQAETGHAWRQIRHAWCLGSKIFRDQLLVEVADQSGPNHYAEPRRESAEERAEQLVREELHSRGWDESALSKARKGDPVKVQMARRLRKETTVGLRWIAARLHMGTWNNLANCLYSRSSTARAESNAALQRKNGARAIGATPASDGDKVLMTRTDPLVDLSIVRTDPSGELPTHCL